jgi:hypothetical protein
MVIRSLACAGGIAWIALLGACGLDATGPRARRPAIEAATLSANEHNVLSVIASVQVHDADSVSVRYRPSNAPSSEEVTTPSVMPVAGAADIPVLGLQPATRYSMIIVAHGQRDVVLGDPLEITTGALPADIPHFLTEVIDPSPGYVLFATPVLTLVIDNGGRVVWYRRYENGPGLNFMAQPTGHYVVHPPTLAIGDIEPWLELDPLGNVARTLTCVNGLPSRLHDLILEADGSYRILCDEVRTMDLSAVGGVANARVTGTVVQHVERSGQLRSQWSSFDHFEITDVDIAERRGQNVNWTHGNALALDTDGNILLSFRNLGEITKINASTGAVLWRLGGLRNQFTFLGSPTPAFARQHGLRWAAPGMLVLLDNMGDPAESRAERYVIDEAAHTARLVQSYGSAPGVVTEIGGSVQPLAGGRTLVSFGTAGRVEEYDAQGRLVWRITGNPGYVFRAQRILSLYAPGVGTAR